MLSELQQGRNVVLCSIIASSGSTPRGTGAKMAVFEDGSTLGTVGGGAVEYHTELLAREIHKTRHSQSKGFLLTKNDVADIGMICGGAVTVYFQFLDAAKPETTALISHILTLLQTNANAWLILAMRDGCPNGHYLPPSLQVAAGKALCCPACGARFYAPCRRR